jgi:hypothetical protein
MRLVRLSCPEMRLVHKHKACGGLWTPSYV